VVASDLQREAALEYQAWEVSSMTIAAVRSVAPR